MFAGQIAESLGLALGLLDDRAGRRRLGDRQHAVPAARHSADAGARLDWLGFLSLSAGIAAAQLVFSRGQRLDWFDSTEIVIATLVAGLAIYMFCVHSLTSERAVRAPDAADRPQLLPSACCW